MIINKSRAFLATAALFLGLAATAFAGGDGGMMPLSPAMRLETLPNGLRTVILPCRTEPGHVSVRLIVLAGSLDERDDERGYAHFVEHMAFEGTTHYPSGRLVLFLQRLGLGFGADLNADTSFTHTIYKLDLPATRYLPEALGVLRDYADGLAFPAYALDRQRGVVLSELHARETAQYGLTTQMVRAVYAGTALPERMPLGDEGLIQIADARKLRAYYQRCYRPERMIVLVVGDVSADSLEPALEKVFSSMAGVGPPISPVKPGTPVFGLPSAHLVWSPVETAAAADLYALVAPSNTRAGFHERIADNVVIALLNRRLEERARGSVRIGNAFALSEYGPDRLFMHFRLEAQAAADDWQSAVEVLEQELRRAQTEGFRPQEVREAATLVLADMQVSRDQSAAFVPATLADLVAGEFAAGRPWLDGDAGVADASEYLARFTLAQADAALRSLFSQNGLCLVVRRPTPMEGGSEAVLSAYRASAAQPLPLSAPSSDAPLLFHYGDMLSAGTIARRRTEPDLRLDLVTFANGVRLNLRPAARGSNRFGLIARLGRGIADTPRDKPRIEYMALALFLLSDLGRNSRDEVARLLHLHGVEFNFNITDYQMTIAASGPSAELPFTFRLLSAYLSDLNLEPVNAIRALGQYAIVRNKALGSTEALASAVSYYHMASDDPRALIPPTPQISRYSFEDISTWMRAHWLNGPLEIGITGEIDVESCITAAAITIGALPARSDVPLTGEEGLALQQKPYRNTIQSRVPDQVAALRIAWPARGAADMRLNPALQLAIDAVVDRLRIQMRDDLGATYAPRGGVFEAPDQPEFCYAWIELTFDPRQANRLSERALRLAGDLAANGVTEEEFARLREPRRAETAAQLGSNLWWVQNVLDRAQSRPGIIADARSLITAYSTLTREDVNRAAAQFLRSDQATAILIVPRGVPAPQ